MTAPLLIRANNAALLPLLGNAALGRKLKRAQVPSRTCLEA
jgi:hypothetical protein